MFVFYLVLVISVIYCVFEFSQGLPLAVVLQVCWALPGNWLWVFGDLGLLFAVGFVQYRF